MGSVFLKGEREVGSCSLFCIFLFCCLMDLMVSVYYRSYFCFYRVCICFVLGFSRVCQVLFWGHGEFLLKCVVWGLF